MVPRLVKTIADLKAIGHEGDTPLHVLCEQDDDRAILTKSEPKSWAILHVVLTTLDSTSAQQLTHGVPQLVDVAISLKTPYQKPINLFGEGAPRLRCIDLKGLSIPWDSLILHNLRTLKLDFTGITGDLGVPGLPSATAVHQVLRQCPDLEVFHLAHPGEDGSEEIGLNAELSSLKEVHLSGLGVNQRGVAWSIMLHLEAPQCEVIHLGYSIVDAARIRDALGRSLISTMLAKVHPKAILNTNPEKQVLETRITGSQGEKALDICFRQSSQGETMSAVVNVLSDFRIPASIGGGEGRDGVDIVVHRPGSFGLLHEVRGGSQPMREIKRGGGGDVSQEGE